MDRSITIADKYNIDSGALDQSTLQGGSGTVLSIKNSGVTATQIATSVAGDGLSGGAGTALAVNVDASTIEINTDTLRVKDLGIVTDKIAASAVTTAKIAALNVTRAKIEAVGQQVSSSCGGFLLNSSLGTYADVTNLSVTITTSGRPVIVVIQPDGSANSASLINNVVSQTFSVKILRDTTEVNWRQWAGGSGDSIHVQGDTYTVDVVGAGTYTYKVQAARTFGTTGTTTMNYYKLVVYEL